MNQPVFLLDEEPIFPPVELAQNDPNGLLAIGGDLSVERLVEAYRNGIFPWFCEDEPILWWSPDPRCVFYLDQLHVSRSLQRELKKQHVSVTINTAFEQVMANCAAPRASQSETWILPEMMHAYQQLHKQGYAHSVEVWQNDVLVGGLYGLSMGRFFFGESMFSKQPNTSKMALVYLANYLKQHDFLMIDCQVGNPHLYSLGAQDLPRSEFSNLLQQSIDTPQDSSLWQPKTLERWC
ncbi:MAG: leucyl/phenylalanyl-tRNA--protein transferase [Kangiellaceae bacterium]|nr:leucyl/phenylalanyl-tRNA--protein transferase [Kangiellaceae bacterium]